MMNEKSIKRSVTQQELDAVYAQLPTFAPAVVAESRAAGEDTVLPTAVHSVGVHIHKDRTVLVWLGNHREAVRWTALNQGYEQPETLVTALTEALAQVRGKKTPVYVCLTGVASPLLFADFPKLARPTLLKALRLQFRAQFGEEPEEMQLQALGNTKAEKQTSYLALGVKKSLLESILRPLRKQKIRVTAWDADLLCYVRAASALWEKHGAGQSSRFLIILEWDHCFLLVADHERRLLALRLSVGVQSFLQHLVSTREGQALPENESVDVRARRLNTNQAIHDVYIPFAQQIKTQLFAACNEQGIALPTHFALVASGANLFQMVESLSYDLGLTPVVLTSALSPEAVAAYGAALYEEKDLFVNALPRGRGEWARTLREWIRASWARVSPAQSISDTIPLNAGVIFGIPFLILMMLAIVPSYQRWKVSARLAQARRDQASLEVEKKRIASGKERESLYDKKMHLVSQIELKQWKMSSALKELFTAIPSGVRLKSLTYKDGLFILKGVTQESSAVENFLKASMDLRLLVEPTPVDVRREKKQTTFEITFRFKG